MATQIATEINRDKQTLAHLALSKRDRERRRCLRRRKMLAEKETHNCTDEIILLVGEGPFLSLAFACPVCGVVVKTIDDFTPPEVKHG